MLHVNPTYHVPFGVATIPSHVFAIHMTLLVLQASQMSIYLLLGSLTVEKTQSAAWLIRRFYSAVINRVVVTCMVIDVRVDHP